MEQRMLALVRYRLEHPDYLHDDTYGTQLLDCFQRLRDTYPMGFTRFHLPWCWRGTRPTVSTVKPAACWRSFL